MMHSLAIRGLTAASLLWLLDASVSPAGEAPASAPLSEPAATKLQISYEVEADYSYVGPVRTEIGGHHTGNLTEQSGSFRLIMAPRWGEGPIFRFGIAAQRFSFGLPDNAPLPNTLQSTSLVLGIDLQLFDSWLVRVEAEPGFYSDFHDIGRGDFNVPFIIGGSYIAGASLQWIIGLGVDVNRRYPVIPAVGLRWNFMDKWTLDAVLPTPRLEYEAKKGLTFYAGGDLKTGTYRVSENFGDAHGRRALNDAIVEYDEIRVGGGISWKAMPGVTLEAEAGYLPYREFNYHRAEQGYKSKNGGAYGQVGLSAKF